LHADLLLLLLLLYDIIRNVGQTQKQKESVGETMCTNGGVAKAAGGVTHLD
jgi:hypothetical protein